MFAYISVPFPTVTKGCVSPRCSRLWGQNPLHMEITAKHAELMAGAPWPTADRSSLKPRL